MNPSNLKRVSKFLSLILRHNPGKIGLTLDSNGWADVNELIQKFNQQNFQLDRFLLEEVVSTNDKQRFTFNEDHSRIRANQGHSIEVDLQLEPISPPDFLFHGTVGKSVASILSNGLQKMNRQHVHLSKDRETAIKVGSRRGVPVILTIASGLMAKDGLLFYQSANGVWLCDGVPAKYIQQKS